VRDRQILAETEVQLGGGDRAVEAGAREEVAHVLVGLESTDAGNSTS
jgi:hypothetical protein